MIVNKTETSILTPASRGAEGEFTKALEASGEQDLSPVEIKFINQAFAKAFLYGNGDYLDFSVNLDNSNIPSRLEGDRVDFKFEGDNQLEPKQDKNGNYNHVRLTYKELFDAGFKGQAEELGKLVGDGLVSLKTSKSMSPRDIEKRLKSIPALTALQESQDLEKLGIKIQIVNGTLIVIDRGNKVITNKFLGYLLTAADNLNSTNIVDSAKGIYVMLATPNRSRNENNVVDKNIMVNQIDDRAFVNLTYGVSSGGTIQGQVIRFFQEEEKYSKSKK